MTDEGRRAADGSEGGSGGCSEGGGRGGGGGGGHAGWEAGVPDAARPCVWVHPSADKLPELLKLTNTDMVRSNRGRDTGRDRGGLCSGLMQGA